MEILNGCMLAKIRKPSGSGTYAAPTQTGLPDQKGLLVQNAQDMPEQEILQARGGLLELHVQVHNCLL